MEGEKTKDAPLLQKLVELTMDADRIWNAVPELSWLERAVCSYYNDPELKKAISTKDFSHWFGLTESQLEQRYESASSKIAIWNNSRYEDALYRNR